MGKNKKSFLKNVHKRCIEIIAGTRKTNTVIPVIRFEFLSIKNIHSSQLSDVLSGMFPVPGSMKPIKFTRAIITPYNKKNNHTFLYFYS